MRKIFILTLAIFISSLIFAQSGFYGITKYGGTSNGGVIFKTDNSGNNQSVLYNFQIENVGEYPKGKLCQTSNGKLYGVTSSGGSNGYGGVIYEYDPNTGVYITKIEFGNSNGYWPLGSLIQASNGKLYGMTYYGGSNNEGVIFEYDPATNIFTKKIDFNGTNGNNPCGSLMQASNGKLYGMTQSGGSIGYGVLFEYNIITNTLTKKIDFNDTIKGAFPMGSLIQSSSGELYGMTQVGGSNNKGVLFEYSLTNSTFTKKIDFDGTNKGSSPYGSLMQASNGKLYGMTSEGGSNNIGVLFEYNLTNSIFTKKIDFDGTNKGSSPYGSLLQASNGKLYGMTKEGGNNNKGVLFEYSIVTDSLIKKTDYDGANKGSNPDGSIMQASNGKLYGTTLKGGGSTKGVLFEYDLTTNGFTKKIDFQKAINGNCPSGSLILASNEKLYGMTSRGGSNSHGVLFEYNPTTNIFTKKLDFDDTLLGYPVGSLMQATNGKLYGMATEGGSNYGGVIFEYDPTTNILTKKIDFDGNNNGSNPFNGLMQASNGKLFGMTAYGGQNNKGVLFEYDPTTNVFTKKIDFDGINKGATPDGLLTQAANGKLYGTTEAGGSNNKGVLFEYDPTTNIFTKKIDFDGTNKGSYPLVSLLQASNGKLYGMTFLGGSNNKGVLFEYDPVTNLFAKKIDFDGINKGSEPYSDLMQASNGKLYGTTYRGGNDSIGVLFEYDPASEIFTKKMDFNNVNGNNPLGSLTELISQSASFTTSQTTFTTPPFNPSFTNTSSGYHSYVWNFGDGDMSNQTSPSHTYLYNGTYTVTLFATDSVSNTTDTATTIITCSGGACNFNSSINQPQSTAICVGDTLMISLNSIQGATYQWLNDGINISGANDTIIYAIDQGYYTAVITKDNCSVRDSINISINPLPIVSILSNYDTSYCSNESAFSLIAIPIGGVFSGNGMLDSTFSPAIANHGSNLIVYTYTDTNGCTDSATTNITVNALPTISFSPIADVCADVASVNLTTNPSGGVFTGQAVTNQGIFYPQMSGIGTFALSYSYIDSNGCSNSANSSIKVKSIPTSNFTIPATLCLFDTAMVNYTGTASSTAAFTWSFDNANIYSGIGEGPYNISWNTDGLKQINLSVVDSGCTSTISSNYTNIANSFAMIISVGATSACYGDSITLFANTGIGYSYQWHETSGILTGDTLSYFDAVQSSSYFCEVTTANSCVALSDTISITIKPQLLADFTLAANACIGDMVAVSFNGSIPTGATYNWNFNSGTIASGSGAGPYNIIWNINGIQTVGLMVNENGCSSDLMEKNINIISTPAMIIALGSTSFCDGDNVSLSANSGPYSYQWFKDGVSTSNTQPIFIASSTGSYTVEVTDVNNNCSNISDSVAVVVNTTDFNLAFSATPTNFTIPPFNTSFSNQTVSANDYYWMWNFGDGNSSTFVNPTHLYGYDGTYTVGVIAQNITSGCFDTLVKIDYINCIGGNANPCTLDPTFGNIGGNFVCPDDSVKLFANNHTTGITYQWLRDGILINGASDSVYFAGSSGLYQLMVADDSCTVFSQPFVLTQRITVIPSILTNGDIQPCTNDSMELYVSTSFNAYQWSNGANSSSIYINKSGSYIVSVTDNNGCLAASSPFVVNASLLQVPDICIVGIDSATNHNRVVWERENSDMTDSFNIYRESTVAGVYNLIGSQPFSTLSVFEDVNSNPAQMAYRYRITAVDTCGMETAPSPIHKTLHLTINAGLGDVWNLIWTNYEGFNFGSYRIYRGSDSTGLQLLTQIQSTLTSYTDLIPPTGNVYYQIEIIAPHQCFPDSIYSKANTNYNTSRSNTANTAGAQNIGFAQSIDNNISMMLFPNPNNGNFTLEINSTNSSSKEYQLEVYSVMGKLIHQEKLNGSASLKKQMHFETLSKGVYFVRLRSENATLNSKFIIN